MEDKKSENCRSGWRFSLSNCRVFALTCLCWWSIDYLYWPQESQRLCQRRQTQIFFCRCPHWSSARMLGFQTSSQNPPNLGLRNSAFLCALCSVEESYHIRPAVCCIHKLWICPDAHRAGMCCRRINNKCSRAVTSTLAWNSIQDARRAY